MIGIKLYHSIMSLLNSFSISNFFPVLKYQVKVKKYFYGVIFVAFLMAFLELGQDYISSVLNDNYFSPVHSLSYKLFWFFFIPFSFFLVYWFDNVRSYFYEGIYFISSAFIILLVALAHLIIFSLLLYTISYVVYEEPWPLYYLLTEKLSTRLYIGLSYYIIFSVIYYRLKNREEANPTKDKSPLKSISVKNGQSTKLVDVDEIRWINSDGHYLEINTVQKKYIILDSLKNIITDLPENFKRIHRSTIVNIDYIKELKSRGNGDYNVVMKCGGIIRLSRNFTKSLRGLLL